jgi:hypothetical protein
MRTLFGALAVLLGLASICLTARYGYKSADTTIDGVISAVVFGSIALCAFLFDAAAVRLWFMRHYVGSALIGFIAAAALVVTFSNSLGSIVSRTDAVLAQRQGVAESRADNRRELLRLEKALADLGRFAPADWEAVKQQSGRQTRRRAIKLLSATSAARTAASANWMRQPLQPIWRPSPRPKLQLSAPANWKPILPQ